MREREKKHGIKQKKQQEKFTAEGWHVEIEREEERQLWEGMQMEGNNYWINLKIFFSL